MTLATRQAKTNLRLDIRDAGIKQQVTTNFEPKPGTVGGCLSPNLQPATPPTFPNSKEPLTATKVADKYLLLNRLEGSILRRCIHIESQQEYVCKVSKYVLFNTNLNSSRKECVSLRFYVTQN